MQQTEQDRAERSVIKKRGIGARSGRLLHVVLLYAAVALLISACAEWVPHERAFEVTVDLTAEGQRMQITRRILCEGDVRREIGVVTTRIYWQAKTRSFGARLPSGGAVMVVTPSLCWSAYRKDGAADDRIPIAKDHVPLIGWADNAEDPKVIEAYISPSYFHQANARIRYHGMTARVIDLSSAYATDDDGYGWFGASRVDHDRYAFYALPIAKEEWSQISGVAEHIRGLRTLSVLQDDARRSLSTSFRVPYDPTRLLSGDGLYGTPRPDALDVRESSTDQLSANLANARPLLLTPRGFQMSEGVRGYFIAYESSRLVRSHRTENPIVLRLGGTEVEVLPVRIVPTAIYEPRTQTIFRIGSGLVPFPSAGLLQPTPTAGR